MGEVIKDFRVVVDLLLIACVVWRFYSLETRVLELEIKTSTGVNEKKSHIVELYEKLSTACLEKMEILEKKMEIQDRIIENEIQSGRNNGKTN